MYEVILRSSLRAYQYRLAWSDFKTAYCLYNREAELTRLIRWAVRQRLTKPRRLYERRLGEMQDLLFRIQRRSPGASRWAQRVQRLAAFLFPPPLYPGKGSASGYK
jgi:hypothetical protein